MTSGYETVLAALTERDLIVQSWSGTVSAKCPAHDDTRPSLSLKEADDGKALLYCHAGCDIKEIAASLDLSMSDLFNGTAKGAVVATYEYRDEEDNTLYRVLRLSPKGFFQERWEDGEWKPRLRDTRRVPYHLSRLISAVQAGETVYITEGEKDADNLIAQFDVVATTLLGGANKWRDDYAQFFKGARVVVVGDNDDAGRLHCTTLKARLHDVADSIRVYYPAVGKDVTDHILAGLTLEELVPEGSGLDEFIPLDWEHYEVPETTWLVEPFIPRHGRVLAFGAAGSLKSLWAMWVGTKLAEEGKKVAYFSLEMLPSDTARRLKQLKPPRENFKVFTHLRLGTPEHTNTLIAGLKDTDLIIIDSWSAARAHQGYETNADIAELDKEVFLPIIKLTGAALLILDNTGHAVFTDEGKHKADHARGASAKGDKMEVTLWFDRPYEDDNYATRISFKKMRLDYPMPKPVIVKTPKDKIEFYHLDTATGKLGQPLWAGMQVMEEDVGGTDVQPATAIPGEDPEVKSWKEAHRAEPTPAERRALARAMDMFKAEKVKDEA